jgi:hypothetical protein
MRTVIFSALPPSSKGFPNDHNEPVIEDEEILTYLGLYHLYDADWLTSLQEVAGCGRAAWPAGLTRVAEVGHQTDHYYRTVAQTAETKGLKNDAVEAFVNWFVTQAELDLVCKADVVSSAVKRCHGERRNRVTRTVRESLLRYLLMTIEHQAQVLRRLEYE